MASQGVLLPGIFNETYKRSSRILISGISLSLCGCSLVTLSQYHLWTLADMTMLNILTKRHHLYNIHSDLARYRKYARTIHKQELPDVAAPVDDVDKLTSTMGVWSPYKMWFGSISVLTGMNAIVFLKLCVTRRPI